MINEECIFCKIANGKIPSKTLYEDEKFRVIFDINPASFGHAIILPKHHAADIYSLPEEDAEKIFLVAQKIAKALKEVLPCEGMNILQNNGEAAGQSVFHLHVHVIPRYKEDGIHIKWKPEKADIVKLEELIGKIKLSGV